MEHVDIRFDEQAFFRAVNQHREAEGLSWRELGRRLGLSSSTFSRLARGRRPDVDTFLKLIAWLEMPAEAFLLGHEPKTESRREDVLTTVATALRRAPGLRPSDVASLEEIVRIAYNGFRRASRR